MKFLSVLAIASLVSAATVLEEITALKGKHTPRGNNITTLLDVAAKYPSVLKALGGENFTLFAPINEGFDEVANGPSGAVLKNETAVEQILLYHYLPGVRYTPDGKKTAFPTALTVPGITGKGQAVVVTAGPSNVTVGSAFDVQSEVIETIVADNGIVHLVKKVLIPPAKASETLIKTGLTSLADALVKASLVPTVESLKDITVFAPVNDALNKAFASGLPALPALQGTLTYHVVPKLVYSSDLKVGTLDAPTALPGTAIQVIVNSTGAFVKGQVNNVAFNIVKTDVLIDNGVVHVIDGVLTPDASKLPTEPLAGTISPNDRNVNSNGFVAGLSATVATVVSFLAFF